MPGTRIERAISSHTKKATVKHFLPPLASHRQSTLSARPISNFLSLMLQGELIGHVGTTLLAVLLEPKQEKNDQRYDDVELESVAHQPCSILR